MPVLHVPWAHLACSLLWGSPVPAVMVIKVQSTGRGGLSSPVCLDTKLNAPRSLAAAGTCHNTTPPIGKVVGRYVTKLKASRDQSRCL